MVRAQFIKEIYSDSYNRIKQHTRSISHQESIWQPPFGGNAINWIMGHLVVSRINVLMPLDVPSIWTMEQCRRFIPGSAPVTSQADSVPFDRLLEDFDRTQGSLVYALERLPAERLAAPDGERSIAESLLYYHAHETEHAGYLELLCRLANF